MPHHARTACTTLALIATLTLFLCVPPFAAHGRERVATAMSELMKAPYQLEITTLSVETKQGPHVGESIWCRVRVDRVLAGPGLKTGDETAIVSVRYHNPPGTAGASGHWNIPGVGERRRVYATGTAQTLQPMPPNGWQPMQREVAFVGVSAPTARPGTLSTPWADFAASLTAVGRSTNPVSADLLILTAPLTTEGVDPRDVALASRMPLVITGPALFSLAWPQLPATHSPSSKPATPVTPAAPSTPQLPLPPIQGEANLAAIRIAAGLTDPKPPTTTGRDRLGFRHTRILPPDAVLANHPVLVGINIPSEGLVVASRIAIPQEAPLQLLPNVTVLLWGAPATEPDQPSAPYSSTPATPESPASPAQPASGVTPSRFPVLWITTEPRTTPSLVGKPSMNLPPRRTVTTILGEEATLRHPTVRRLLEQSITWTLDLAAVVEGSVPGDAPKPNSR
jgi:hypothetical protein